MIEFNEFIARIKKRLLYPLPGLKSQLKMATIGRMVKDGFAVVPENARKAGVLVLFYPSNGSVNLVFIKRNEYPGVHSGQISFPGGGWEEGDQDMIATALREAEEEIGVARDSVIPIGNLSDLYIPPSNFLVTPVIGYTDRRPDFRPDPDEVDQVLEIALEKILDKATRQEKEITIFPAIKSKVPCYYAEGSVIWGATAMILSELNDAINQEL